MSVSDVFPWRAKCAYFPHRCNFIFLCVIRFKLKKWWTVLISAWWRTENFSNEIWDTTSILIFYFQRVSESDTTYDIWVQVYKIVQSLDARPYNGFPLGGNFPLIYQGTLVALACYCNHLGQNRERINLLIHDFPHLEPTFLMGITSNGLSSVSRSSWLWKQSKLCPLRMP